MGIQNILRKIMKTLDSDCSIKNVAIHHLASLVADNCDCVYNTCLRFYCVSVNIKHRLTVIAVCIKIYILPVEN